MEVDCFKEYSPLTVGVNVDESTLEVLFKGEMSFKANKLPGVYEGMLYYLYT